MPTCYRGEINSSRNSSWPRRENKTKIASKQENSPKSQSSGYFPILKLFFSYFPGEATSYFGSYCLPISGRNPSVAGGHVLLRQVARVGAFETVPNLENTHTKSGQLQNSSKDTLGPCGPEGCEPPPKRLEIFGCDLIWWAQTWPKSQKVPNTIRDKMITHLIFTPDELF